MRKKDNGTSDGNPPDDDLNEDGAALHGTGGYVRYLIGDQKDIDILIATAAKIADQAQGREQLKLLMTSAFDARYGGVIKRLERELSEAEEKYSQICEDLKKAVEADYLTPARIATSKANQERKVHERIEEPFGEWQARHRFEARVLQSALVLALAASGYTAWANLVGTGLPIFLDNPALPVAMSSLAPMSSIAIKTMWHSLGSPKALQLFSWVLNISTLGLIGSWAVLFSLEYAGLSSAPVTAGLFDDENAASGSKSVAFVTISLLTEMAIGCAIAHRIDTIKAIYSPDYEQDNPGKELSKTRVAEYRAETDRLLALILKLTDELAGYSASLKAQVELALIKYDARRSRLEEDTL